MHKVFIMGDLHGQFGYLNTFICKKCKKGDIVICCGDFGYFPNLDNDHKKIKTHGTKVLFCDGNHEDHWSLRSLKDNEICKNVFYMSRGSTYELPDGRNILFMGGALSIDKLERKTGIDWFPEETISYNDMLNLPRKKIDIIVSHTCPDECLDIMLKHNSIKKNDCSTKALSQLLELYKPELWFFGHWHKYDSGIINNTKWYCLNMVKCTNYYKELRKR